MSNNELALHEERAQHGIIEFAEEMQLIRDQSLYPGAKQESDAWKSYCKDRWGMSKNVVDETIRALPVLKRLMHDAGVREMPTVSAASRVATLPEPVQDAILAESPKRNDASDKAKAVRKAAERIRVQEDREATVDELVEIAKAPVKQPHKPKSKMKPSKFTSMLSQAVSWAEDAADYAQSNILDDVENEFAFSRVEKLRYHADRIAERIHRPEHVRDLDEEAAALLGGDER